MEIRGMQRVSSAGYRLQPRTPAPRPRSSQTHGGWSAPTPGDHGASPDQDPVRQDLVWREMVWKERRGAKEWEKNWDFLKKFDDLGKPKQEPPLPSNVSVFSELIPNTNNQMIGSRLTSPMGQELLRMNRLLVLSCSHQRRKLDPEMLPA
ncbi:unnamed protein product [Knipowitschia caucasica]|uniref:Uncharacterized protein n=1 Tax=Knipowitschia caucasica TaxID=637954 RepID=A0AAV2JGC2_KNICA